MPRRKTETCAHPDCAHPIEPDTKSKVCQIHLHHMPFCRCKACRRRTVPEATPVRDDVRRVKVATMTGHSGAVAHMRVSLSREPWEVPA